MSFDVCLMIFRSSLSEFHSVWLCSSDSCVAGTLCEWDIDECESSPCQNGGVCTDKVNAFECDCAAGYTGRLCAVEIDECLQPTSPCANNGTCVDLVADYRCDCVGSWLSGKLVQYGGRNCTVQLTGCHENECSNGATCHPLLLNESSNIHGYSCSCLPGYHGNLCKEMTSVSFDSRDAWIRYQISPTENTSISFQFRTTLPGEYNTSAWHCWGVQVCIKHWFWQCVTPWFTLCTLRIQSGMRKFVTLVTWMRANV